MRSTLLPSLRLLAVLTLLTGVVYPLATTGAASLLFPRRAHGSLVARDGHVVGSELVGQAFRDPRYLWGRPATSTPPYDGRASGGSNLGPSNPALAEAVAARVAALRAADPDATGPVPVDLVTASASGLDPHVSPEAARYQAARIARARGVPVAQVLSVIDAHTAPRTFGLLGEPRVHVLGVNLALDAAARDNRAR